MGRWIEYVKYVLIALLLVFMISLLGRDDTSQAKLGDVTKKVVKSVSDDGLSKADHQMIKRLYGINANDYAGVSLYVSNSNMKVEEILVVKLKDAGQSEAVEAAVKNRLDTQLESFEGYGAKQTKLLKDHILDVKGNYVLYVVHKKAKKADGAFQKSL